MTAEGEKALLVEVLRRQQSAIDVLHKALEQREYARGLFKLPFARAWEEGAKEFIELGNWLDVEIDRRTP